MNQGNVENGFTDISSEANRMEFSSGDFRIWGIDV